MDKINGYEKFTKSRPLVQKLITSVTNQSVVWNVYTFSYQFQCVAFRGPSTPYALGYIHQRVCQTCRVRDWSAFGRFQRVLGIRHRAWEYNRPVLRVKNFCLWSLNTKNVKISQKLYHLSSAKCKIFVNKQLIFSIDSSKILHLALATRYSEVQKLSRWGFSKTSKVFDKSSKSFFSKVFP